MIAALIDVDGTLVDSTYHHTLAWSETFRAHGYDVPAARIHRLIGMGGDQLVPTLIGDEENARHGDALREEHGRRFRPMRSQVAPLPGARRLLEMLVERSVEPVLVTSAAGEEVEHYIGLLEADDLVPHRTTEGDVDRTKPDPQVIEIALAQSNADVALVLGDSVWDCRAAVAAGLAVVAVTTGGFCAGELRDAGAAAVLDGIPDVCDRLDELLDMAAAPAG